MKWIVPANASATFELPTDQRSRPTASEWVVLLAALILFPVIKIHVVGQLPAVRDYADTGARQGWYVTWATYGAQELLITAAIVSTRGRRWVRDQLSLQGLRPIPIAAGILAFAAAVVIVLQGLSVVPIPELREQSEHLVISGPTPLLRVALMAAAGVGVVFEELIFRGFAIRTLSAAGLSSAIAISLPALAFGYVHGGAQTVSGLVETLLVTAAAIGLGWLHVRAGRLSECVALHLAWVWVLIAAAPT